MKTGLEKIPGVHDLATAYDDLLGHFKNEIVLPPKSFAIYSQWTRFDSRLGEICVQYLLKNWRRMNPAQLHTELSKLPWPAVIGVLAEFVERQLITTPDEALFKNWKILVTTGFANTDWEQFFIGKRRIGGRAMFEDARFSLEEYRKWGYLSREILINKPKLGTASYSVGTRYQILIDLLSVHSRITTDLYWETIGRAVSRRQAERDLLACKLLKAVGRTKGRFFTKQKS